MDTVHLYISLPAVAVDTQIDIPASFVALFMPEGARRPAANRGEIADRHELCEDMAQALVETARDRRMQLGVAEGDVLWKIQSGLDAVPEVVSAAEARWVVRRLAELLDWDAPAESG